MHVRNVGVPVDHQVEVAAARQRLHQGRLMHDHTAHAVERHKVRLRVQRPGRALTQEQPIAVVVAEDAAERRLQVAEELERER